MDISGDSVENAPAQVAGEQAELKTVCVVGDCGALAVIKYDGDHLCQPHAREFYFRDLEEGDIEPGFGED